jgi:hypothetical protein
VSHSLGPIRFSLDCEKFLSQFDLYTRNACQMHASLQRTLSVLYAALSH